MALLLRDVFLHQVTWLSTAPNFLTVQRPHSKEMPPPPLLNEVPKRRTPGLAVLTWGGGVPKESVNPYPGTKRLDFNFTICTFQT